MGLVLEEDQPLLGLRAVSVIHFDGDHDGAGVVLVRLFLVREPSVRLELLHAHGRKIHQAHIFVISSLVEFLSRVEIAQVGGFDDISVIAVLEFHVAQLGGESGVTAVIRPVGVENTDLGDRRVSVLCSGKIFLNEQKVIKSHGEAERAVQIRELVFLHGGKTGEYLDVIRLGIVRLQRLRLFHAGLAGVDGVDAVLLDPVELFVRDIAEQNVGLCRADHGILILIEKLDALHGAVRSLVELAGKGFNAEHAAVLRDLNRLMVENINGRLGKNCPARGFKNFIGDILHIVSDQFPNSGQPLNRQKADDIILKLPCCYCVGLLLLHIDPSDFTHRSRSLLLYGV